MSVFDAVSSSLTQPNAAAAASTARILKSDWTGLNQALLGKFYPLKRDTDKGWVQSYDVRTISAADKFTVDDGYEVWAPITDASFELSLNWHSPFEGAGAESKAPTISSMLQAGALSPGIQAISERLSGGQSTDASLARAVSVAEGRVGITKLNSTQVFQGMPPAKLSMTLLFRAVVDPVKEVQNPISMLEQWAAPQYLASDGVITNTLKNGGKQPVLETVFPSMAPQILGFRYGDRTYEPMVIESISEPITTPRNINGVSISASVQITLATLAALDRRDVMHLYR